jgi:hypothetical protein
MIYETTSLGPAPHVIHRPFILPGVRQRDEKHVISVVSLTNQSPFSVTMADQDSDPETLDLFAEPADYVSSV